MPIQRMHLTRSVCRLVVLAFLCLTAGRADAQQEWSRFRGPDGNGIGTDDVNIPAEFGEEDYNWKIALPGGGHSSPVVWGERIFVTCGDDATGEQTLACVNAADGSVAWTREFAAQRHNLHGENSYASSSPAADAHRVYVCWRDPQHLTLQALTHDGKDVWKVDLGGFAANHGGGASPVVVDDLVILPNDNDNAGFLVALDAATGERRWTVPRKAGKFSASTPCVFRPEGGGPAQLVFTALAHGMTGVDAKTGTVLWEIPDAWDSRTVGSPAAGAGLVVATCGEGPGGHWLLAVKPGGADGKAAEVAYKITDKTPYVPTPLIHRDLLFYWSDTGFVTCAKAATGETLWQERVGGAGGYFASPVCAGGELFNVSKQGEVVVVSASEKYELLGKTKLGLDEKVHATPAIADGRMYLRTYTHLISLGGKK